jgi:hypothetical protein
MHKLIKRQSEKSRRWRKKMGAYILSVAFNVNAAEGRPHPGQRKRAATHVEADFFPVAIVPQ